MADLLKDKTSKVLKRMSFPVGLGMLSTFLFQVIDTYFVGKLGSNALAALSFSSTIYLVLVSLYMGLSIGVSIIIGQAAGEGNKTKVKQTTLVAIVLSLVLSSLLSTIVILFIDPIFTALGTDVTILPLVKEYTIPILIGMPLLSFGIMAGGILRASGNITKPEVLMALAGVLNLVFDYALIFGKWGLPQLGIKGAAYATVISWASILIGMIFLLFKDKLIGIVKNKMESSLSIVKQIFKLGTPTIVTQIIGPATITFHTFLLAKESPLAVAAFGVASRIEMLMLIGVLAVSTVITPFIAQNSGAKAHKRIDEAIVFGGKASTYLGILLAVLLYIFVKPIAGIFSNDENVLGYTSSYFYIVSLSYVFYALYIITTAIFNGLQYTLKSLKITAVKSLVFSVPLTLIGSIWGTVGIFIGLSLSNVLAGIYSSWEMRKEIRKNHAELDQVDILKDYASDFKHQSK